MRHDETVQNAITSIMNIKLHTPKSLKMGSGMSSMKQFLLSILATTVSIALTFGTAAIIDHNKNKKAKREIVMMVMYDLYNSLQTVEKADSNIHKAMDIQLKIAEDTTQFHTLKYQLTKYQPTVEFTETIERIFSSNIETINTVDNVLFTENVAEFYQNRQYYKTIICDSIANDLRKEPIFYSIEAALDIDYYFYSMASSDIFGDMQHLFAECKQIMDVTDEEIEAYQKQREQMEKNPSGKEDEKDSIMNDSKAKFERLQKAKERLGLK